MSQGTGTVWHRPGGGKQPGAWGAPPSVCTDGRMQSWAQQEVSQGQLTWPVTPGRSPVLLGLSFLAVLWLNELLLLSSLPLTPTGGSMGDLFLSSSLETWHCLCQEGCSLPGSGGRARLGTGRGHLSWSQALLWVQLCFRSLAWAGAGPLTSIWTCCLLTFGWSFAKVSPACIA